MIHPFVPRLVNIHLSSKRNGINYVFCTLINHTSHHSVQWTTFTVILNKVLHDLRTETFKEIAESSYHGEVFTNRMLRLERSEEHTSELQSRPHLVCRLLLEKKKLTPRPALWTFPI